MCWKTIGENKLGSALVENKDGLAVVAFLITAVTVLALVIAVLAFSQKAPEGEGDKLSTLTNVGIIGIVSFVALLYPTIFVIAETTAAFAEADMQEVRRRRREGVEVDTIVFGSA
jgi:choline-glycine betaine transporter